MTYKEAIHWLEIELREWEIECKSIHPTKEALSIAINSLERCIKLCEVDCGKCKHRELWCYMCNRHPSLSDCYEEEN